MKKYHPPPQRGNVVGQEAFSSMQTMHCCALAWFQEEMQPADSSPKQRQGVSKNNINATPKWMVYNGKPY